MEAKDFLLDIEGDSVAPERLAEMIVSRDDHGHARGAPGEHQDAAPVLRLTTHGRRRSSMAKILPILGFAPAVRAAFPLAALVLLASLGVTEAQAQNRTPRASCNVSADRPHRRIAEEHRLHLQPRPQRALCRFIRRCLDSACCLGGLCAACPGSLSPHYVRCRRAMGAGPAPMSSSAAPTARSPSFPSSGAARPEPPTSPLASRPPSSCARAYFHGYCLRGTVGRESGRFCMPLLNTK